MEHQANIHLSNFVDGANNGSIVIDDSVASSDEMVISINKSNDSIVFISEISPGDRQVVSVCEESVDNINNFSCPVFGAIGVDVAVAGFSTRDEEVNQDVVGPSVLGRMSPVNIPNFQLMEENIDSLADADVNNLSVGMANVSISEGQVQPIVISEGRTVADTMIGQQLIGLIQGNDEVFGTAPVGFDKKPSFGFSL